ncbi:VanZ family protein [Pleionea sp. CnH1-48]|uniref:VanZ family protein n=1 Tax=Pleionea sp. CnH1-48 TaxID=2954494 RepID=UPI0020984EB1|nr:VanZ family protein [Pleionea sp. CnH1-48]MCO7225373.1 VanZ family protein [Pleionea sp. CnH1-48]
MLNFIPQKGHTVWKLGAFLSILLLLYLTLTPITAPSLAIENIDKLYHFIAFAGVTWLCKNAFINISALKLFGSLLLLGLMIEIVQHQLPNRSFSWLDWVADGVGIVFVMGLFRTYEHIIQKSRCSE